MKKNLVRASEYVALLEDVSKRWYDNVVRGSKVTADVYLRRLGNFCHSFSATPNELLSLKESEIYNMLLDTISKMEEKGHAGNYIQSPLGFLLKFDYIFLQRHDGLNQWEIRYINCLHNLLS